MTVYVLPPLNPAGAPYSSAVYEVDGKQVLKVGYRMHMFDGRRRPRSVEMVRDKNDLSLAAEQLGFWYAFRSDDKPVFPAQAIKLSRTTNSSTVIVQREASFKNNIHSVLCYLQVFEENYSTSFVEALNTDITDNTIVKVPGCPLKGDPRFSHYSWQDSHYASRRYCHAIESIKRRHSCKDIEHRTPHSHNALHCQRREYSPQDSNRWHLSSRTTTSLHLSTRAPSTNTAEPFSTKVTFVTWSKAMRRFQILIYLFKGKSSSKKPPPRRLCPSSFPQYVRSDYVTRNRSDNLESKAETREKRLFLKIEGHFSPLESLSSKRGVLGEIPRKKLLTRNVLWQEFNELSRRDPDHQTLWSRRKITPARKAARTADKSKLSGAKKGIEKKPEGDTHSQNGSKASAEKDDGRKDMSEKSTEETAPIKNLKKMPVVHSGSDNRRGRRLPPGSI